MALTDSQLRLELKRRGVDVGPVTDSTRGLYVKRLEKLLGEETDKSQEKSNQLSKKASEKRSSKPVKSRKRSPSPVLQSTKNSRNRTKNTLGYSTDENEDEIKRKNMKNDSASGATTTTRSSRSDSKTSFATSKNMDDIGSTPVHRRLQTLANPRRSSSLPKRRSTPLPEPDKYSDDSDDASEHSWVDMASGGTNTTPSLGLNSSNADERLEKFRAEIEAWKKEEQKENPINVLSERRLGSGRRSTVLQNVDQNNQTPLRGTLSNGVPSRALKIVTQSNRNTATVGTSSAVNTSAKTRPWTLNFSSFLPIGTCIFFVILGLLYATMKYDPTLNSGRAIGYDINDKSSENKALHLASLIYDFVGVHAGKRECDGATNDGKRLTIQEMTVKLGIKGGISNVTFLKASKALIENPDWGIVLYREDGAQIEKEEKLGKTFFVDSKQPILSGWCRFTRAVQKVLLRIILTTAVGILIWLGMVYRRYRAEQEREEREQMYIMVQKILDVLRKQYDASEANDTVQPYLPILHVRDMIVPPQDRKKMARVWERAKHFLSASETRIRVENQRILGEDYLVWRWIQATSPAKRHTPTSRVWQGQAFDVKARPMICPTPCLKIRNMFDPDMEVKRNWVQEIEDSILEKCQGNNEILRLCVEKDSKEGLVYMLCGTEQAAGRAFRDLHGAWFDGRLVTVKFIRLTRFHQRFPDSVNQSNTPLRPASAVPVSTMMPPSTAPDIQSYEKLYPTLPDA